MKKVLIIGAGESGLGCALLANKYSHEVFVSDINKINNKTKMIFSHEGINFEDPMIFAEKQQAYFQKKYPDRFTFFNNETFSVRQPYPSFMSHAFIFLFPTFIPDI